MILKICVKNKFVLWQTRFYNLLTEEKDKKIHIFEIFIFLKKCFRWYTFGKFYIAKFKISVKDLIKYKRGFEMFFIDHYAGDIGNKNITGKY